MNRYDRYPGDYLRRTLTLTPAQDGMYGRLMDYYYTTEKPIPVEDVESVARCRNDEDRDVTQWVLRRFFSLVDVGFAAWHHQRIEEEIAKARPRIDAARNNGLRGGRPRKKPTGFVVGNPAANPQGTQVESSPSPSPSPSIKHQEQEQKKKRAVAPPSVTKPEEVTEQTWTDWLALRKAKHAPVTETVLNHAKAEAGKAGMSLERFLRVWCGRGSQGLEADWLKPNERGPPAQQPPGKTVSAFLALEALANPRPPDEHSRPAVVRQHDSPRLAAPAAAEPGPDPRERTATGHR